MTRPSPMIRFAGSPVGRLLVSCFCLFCLCGWAAGHIHWWLGIASIMLFFRMERAQKTMRRYNAWASEWQAMGQEDDARRVPVAAVKKPRSAAKLALHASLLGLVAFVLLVMMTGAQHHSGVLLLLWFGTCAACLWKIGQFMRMFRPSRVRSAETAVARRQEKEADSTVSLLIERPSYSPSRIEAEAELPEYAARLLTTVREMAS